jgi:hypothetical protein
MMMMMFVMPARLEDLQLTPEHTERIARLSGATLKQVGSIAANGLVQYMKAVHGPGLSSSSPGTSTARAGRVAGVMPLAHNPALPPPSPQVRQKLSNIKWRMRSSMVAKRRYLEPMASPDKRTSSSSSSSSSSAPTRVSQRRRRSKAPAARTVAPHKRLRTLPPVTPDVSGPAPLSLSPRRGCAFFLTALDRLCLSAVLHPAHLPEPRAGPDDQGRRRGGGSVLGRGGKAIRILRKAAGMGPPHGGADHWHPVDRGPDRGVPRPWYHRRRHPVAGGVRGEGPDTAHPVGAPAGQGQGPADRAPPPCCQLPW